MKKRGRKSAYFDIIKPKEKEIVKLLQEGKSEKDVAKHLGIGWSTWRNNKARYKDLQALVKTAREKPVEELEAKAFECALGFTKTIKKAMKLKEVTYKDGKREKETERLEFYEEEIYIAPSVAMQQFLLKNWKKEKYSNNPAELDVKQKQFELDKKIKEQDIF